MAWVIRGLVSSSDVAAVDDYVDDVENGLWGTAGIASFPNAAVPANDVSLAEVIRSIWAGIEGTATGENGIATWPTAAAYANTVSLAEVIAYVQDAVRNGTGKAMASNKSIADALGTDGTTITDGAVSVLGAIGANNNNNAFSSSTVVADADGSILERLEMLQSHQNVSYNNSRHIAVTADMESATWNVIANSHEVFTVTGLVRLRMWIECTETVTSGGAATIQFGVEGATGAFIGSTTATDLVANELWYDTTPTTVYDMTDSIVMDYIVTGLDVGYELGTADLTNGTIIFHCVWEPLNATGAVVAGAGGTL